MRYTGLGFTIVFIFVLAINLIAQPDSQQPIYKDLSRPIEQRVDDLISRITLEEKVNQMRHSAPAIKRLGIPQYNWWNECLHGVARAGYATVFPQAIGLAATWNTDLMFRIADVISTEARSKHHEYARNNERGIYKGLTFWSPNINIFRDPRWGRSQETYGEDPYLTGQVGVQFVKGLQGNHPKYLKLVATPKHYAVHSGPEPDRHQFDAITDDRDLHETYLPAFRATVMEAKVYSIMCAYNRYRSETCCGSNFLLNEILREKWGFEGYVVSDCGAIRDIHQHHQVVPTAHEAAALAVKSGTDLNCGRVFPALADAVMKGFVSEAEIDVALKRLFTARFKLGMFDPPEMVPYAQIPITMNDTPQHRQLAAQAARESIVPLKNDGLLPLSRNLKRIAVIGPNADNLWALLGNYHGTPSKFVTPLKGIENKVSGHTEVIYQQGCDFVDERLVVTVPTSVLSCDGKPGLKAEYFKGIELAKSADVVVFVAGITARLEGEEMKVSCEGFKGGDRTRIDLPDVQQKLIKTLHETGTPVVLVLCSGSALTFNWAQEHLPAIVQLWYPGEEGGTALADVLFGDYNPAGRLPVTFYKSVDQLPPFTDYNMKGKTYRYFEGEPLYAFGYGLSYTTFAYRNLQVPRSVKNSENVIVTVEVTNTGAVVGDEVVQVYVKDIQASASVPQLSLQGFRRVQLAPGESKTIAFTLKPRQLSLIDSQIRRVVEPGDFEISVGGGQPDFVPATTQVFTATFKVVGKTLFLEL